MFSLLQHDWLFSTCWFFFSVAGFLLEKTYQQPSWLTEFVRLKELLTSWDSEDSIAASGHWGKAVDKMTNLSNPPLMISKIKQPIFLCHLNHWHFHVSVRTDGWQTDVAIAVPIEMLLMIVKIKQLIFLCHLNHWHFHVSVRTDDELMLLLLLRSSSLLAKPSNASFCVIWIIGTSVCPCELMTNWCCFLLPLMTW